MKFETSSQNLTWGDGEEGKKKNNKQTSFPGSSKVKKKIRNGPKVKQIGRDSKIIIPN